MQPFISHRHKQIAIDLGVLVEARLEETILTEASAASDTTLTVKDIEGFAVSDYLLIGELGQEGAEIVKVHASTAPSGSTITLITGGTEFAHAAGTKVYKLQYNQVEISHADTITGTKSVLATQDIEVDEGIHTYVDTSETAGFYFARFKDETGSTFGDYSDGVPYGGWDDNTVGYMAERALRQNNARFNNLLNFQDIVEFINDGLDYVQGKQIRWPQHQELNYIAGQTTRGVRTITLPSTIYNNDTNQSIMGVRIGDGENLHYLDPDEFEQELEETKETTVRTEASATDTTLEVNNSYDFEDSGTLTFYLSGTKYTITYTGVTRDDESGGTAVFSGIPASGDGAITVTIPVGTNIYQDEIEGKPESYTVRNGNLEFHPMADGKYDNQNVYLDFFTVATKVNSQGDTIDQQRYRMIQYYLDYRIKMRLKNDDKLDENDGTFRQFKERLNDAIRTTRSVFTHKMMPKLNRVRYRGSWPNFRRRKSEE